jgi:SAM-dependent methyltransferase
MGGPGMEVLEAAAEAYEAGLVPALMSGAASNLVEAARPGPGERVLDVGCGTGIVARLAAERIGPAGAVVGLDPNPGMRAVAARRAPGIAWRDGTAEALPFADASFDVVLSQFALMFFADRAAAFREMRRVLRPGGRLAVSVLDSLDRNPAYARVADSYGRWAGPEVAAAMRFPFQLGDHETLPALVAGAGFASAAIARRESRGHFASVAQMILADVRGWFPLAGIHLDAATLERVIADAGTSLARFCGPDGAVEFSLAALVATATRP